MVSINTSSVNQPPIASALKPKDNQDSNAPSIAYTESSLKSSNDTQISSHAKDISEFYNTASSYIKSEFMSSFKGYNNGNVTPAAYIDVGKYNDYVFNKAASTMVESAQSQGVNLDKKNVLAQLRKDNPEISGIKEDAAKTADALGTSSVLLKLTPLDKSSLTDIYINSKEKGLDLGQVEVLAVSKAFHTSMGSDAGQGIIMPYDWDWNETDPDKIAAAKASMLPSSSLIEKGEYVRSKLESDLGLGKDFINTLLNTHTGVGLASDATLDFLSKYADIKAPDTF